MKTMIVSAGIFGKFAQEIHDGFSWYFLEKFSQENYDGFS